MAAAFASSGFSTERANRQGHADRTVTALAIQFIGDTGARLRAPMPLNALPAVGFAADVQPR